MSRFKHWSKITRPAYRKTCPAIIGPKSNKKLTKYEIRSSYCWQQFGFIYPYLTPKYHLCLYLELLICIYHYSPIFGLYYPYLVIFALNCPKMCQFGEAESVDTNAVCVFI